MMEINYTDSIKAVESSDFSHEYLQYENGYQILSSFHDALKYEKNMQPLADSFYKNIFDAQNIKRYDWRDKSGQFMQKLDVDCSIEVDTSPIDPYGEDFWLNVSEKFRQVECGDMCIELWSDFEKKKLGWAVSGEPDYYLYITPKYFFWVGKNELFNQLLQKLQQEFTRDNIEKIFKNKHKSSAIVKVNGMEVTLLKTWTENTYYGICVCIPWTTLFNYYILDINMYNHSGQKLDINEVYAR